MELYSWPSSFGLPSWHRDCLAVHTYCRFLGVPVTVHESANPLFTPAGDLPLFKHNGVRLHTFEGVVAHLRTESNFDADYALSAKERSECMAFKKLLEDKWMPAAEFAFWVDAANTKEFTVPWFCKRLPFPLGWFYPPRYRRRAAELVRCVTGVHLDGDAESDLVGDVSMVDTFVTRNALECAQILCQRLSGNGNGNNGSSNGGDFFFGSSPSSLDALIFAHVAPVLKAPLPNQTLRTKLTSYSELVRYVDRIAAKYFARYQKQYEREKEEEEARKAKGGSGGTGDSSNSEDKSSTSLSSKVLPVLAAVSAMAAYAYATDLFSSIVIITPASIR